MDDLFGSERRNTTGEFCWWCAPCFAVNYGAANAAVFGANTATFVVFAAASSAMQWMFCWRCAPRIAAYATTFEGVCGSSSVFAAIIEQRARRFGHAADASAATYWAFFGQRRAQLFGSSSAMAVAHFSTSVLTSVLCSTAMAICWVEINFVGGVQLGTNAFPFCTTASP